MELRTVPNPTRGCGHLKAGGFYARGDTGVGGRLNAWAFVLGEHVIGAWNYNIAVPARQMRIVHLPATLVSGKMSTEPIPLDDFPHLRNLPPVALLDHVGAESYTPWSFFEECGKHGPSRRIPPDIAKAIAKHTPIPILFTHAWMPLVDPHFIEQALEWSETKYADRLSYDPTPFDPEWGITTDAPFRGETHWIVPLLYQMHERSGGKQCHMSRLMTQPLSENVLTSETLLGISWITRCVYVARQEDDEDTLADIFNAGIEPVRIEAE